MITGLGSVTFSDRGIAIAVLRVMASEPAWKSVLYILCMCRRAREDFLVVSIDDIKNGTTVESKKVINILIPPCTYLYLLNFV